MTYDEATVRAAMEAWYLAQPPCRICKGRQHKLDCPNRTQEARFLVAIRERLASTQIAGRDEATVPSELESAAEWLDEHGHKWRGNEWGYSFSAKADGSCSWCIAGVPGTDAPSLRLAILAAARSLGWKP